MINIIINVISNNKNIQFFIYYIKKLKNNIYICICLSILYYGYMNNNNNNNNNKLLETFKKNTITQINTNKFVGEQQIYYSKMVNKCISATLIKMVPIEPINGL